MTYLGRGSDNRCSGSDCPTKALRNMAQRVCEGCAASFLVPRNKVAAGRARFCSVSCASRAKALARHAKTPQVGSANPNWRGGRSRDHLYYKKRFRAKHPEKAAAHDAVFDALRGGRLVRPSVCDQCGVVCRPQGHHDDYTKPLSVRWLCRPCHRIADRARAASVQQEVA